MSAGAGGRSGGASARAPSARAPSPRGRALPYGIRSVKCYEKLRQVGSGTFGKVFKARCRETGRVVALKKIKMEHETEGFPITAIREIVILKTLRHQNIVRMLEIVASKAPESWTRHDVCEWLVGVCGLPGLAERWDSLRIDGGRLLRLSREGLLSLGVPPRDVVRVQGEVERLRRKGRKSGVYMVFEYMEHDLAGLSHSGAMRSFSAAQVKCYMQQLLRGIEHCHRHRVMHRDIKSSNLLVAHDGTLKLADFGLARPIASNVRRYTNAVITRWYRPPELLLGAAEYGLAVDQWSIGCLFAELLIGKPLFPGKDEVDQLNRIWGLCGTPDRHVWPQHHLLPRWGMYTPKVGRERKLTRWIVRFLEVNGRPPVEPRALELLDALLQLDPARRISAVAALDHGYFWEGVRPAAIGSLPRYASAHEYETRAHRSGSSHRHSSSSGSRRGHGRPHHHRQHQHPRQHPHAHPHRQPKRLPQGRPAQEQLGRPAQRPRTDPAALEG